MARTQHTLGTNEGTDGVPVPPVALRAIIGARAAAFAALGVRKGGVVQSMREASADAIADILAAWTLGAAAAVLFLILT